MGAFGNTYYVPWWPHRKQGVQVKVVDLGIPEVGGASNAQKRTNLKFGKGLKVEE